MSGCMKKLLLCLMLIASSLQSEMKPLRTIKNVPLKMKKIMANAKIVGGTVGIVLSLYSATKAYDHVRLSRGSTQEGFLSLTYFLLLLPLSINAIKDGIKELNELAK